MGATSCCINDIANDDFTPILNVDNGHVSFESPTKENLCEEYMEVKSRSDTNFLKIPNRLEILSTNTIKTSGSDVSISFFLDSEPIYETYDENAFANVNSNVSKPELEEGSDPNVML